MKYQTLIDKAVTSIVKGELANERNTGSIYLDGFKPLLSVVAGASAKERIKVAREIGAEMAQRLDAAQRKALGKAPRDKHTPLNKAYTSGCTAILMCGAKPWCGTFMGLLAQINEERSLSYSMLRGLARRFYRSDKAPTYSGIKAERNAILAKQDGKRLGSGGTRNRAIKASARLAAMLKAAEQSARWIKQLPTKAQEHMLRAIKEIGTVAEIVEAAAKAASADADAQASAKPAKRK